MLKLQQQENPKPNSDRTVSNTNAQEDGGNKNHSYDLVFPALPGSKTSEPKNIGINDQCASPKAPPKVQTSTVNNVFSINLKDRKYDNREEIGVEASKRICSQITRETGVEIEIYSSKNMNLTFVVRGKDEKVAKAKRRIIASFLTQATSAVTVPKEYHGQILGTKGTRCKEIEQRTGASIQIPSIQDTSDIINVAGTRDAVEKAVQEIRMISDELSKRSFERIEIPKAFHAFITGGHNEQLNCLMKETGVKLHVPHSSVNRYEITVAGDKEGVQLAIEKIKEMYTKMLREETDTRIDLSCKDIDTIKVMSNNEKKVLIANNMKKKMGDFVTKEIVLGNIKVRNVIINLGKKFIQSINEDCGGHVTLKLPFVKEDNTIVIKGPEDEVDSAITQIQTMVDEVHNSVLVLKVKPEFHKYLIGKKRANVKRIRNLTNTRIIFPPETELKNENIAIVGKKENVKKAKLEFEVMITDISNVVEDRVEINEKYYKSFVAKNGEFLHKLEEECGGVKISFPKLGAGNKVVLKGTKANVTIAKQRLLDFTNVLENTIQVEVNVEYKFHRYFFTKGAEIINRIIDDCNGVSIIFPKLASNDVVVIKGDAFNAEKAKRQIEQIVKDLKNIITITINVPTKHHRHFVSCQADVLNQIIAEYNGVTVTFPQFYSNSTKVLIRGRKDLVEKVKNKINNIVVGLEQRITVDVMIPQRMHRAIIKNHDLLEGMKRDLGVSIQFPERPAENQYNREPGKANVGNENDENRALGVNDKVTIFGKPENCESAKRILINNIPKTIDLNVPSEYRSSLIGTKGVKIRKLSEDYNVEINIPSQEQNADIIKITGVQKNIAEVVEAIKEEMRAFDAYKEDKQLRSYEIQMTIESEFHHMIIGKKGENIRELRNKYGVQVNFPRKNEGNIVTIIGYQKNAELTRDEIQEMVDKLKNVYKEEIYIDSRIHSRLIGFQGRNISQIMDKYHVNIRFSKPDSTNPDLVIVYAHDDATQDDVLDCMDYLEMIEKDYLSDLVVNEAKANLKLKPENQSLPIANHNSQGGAEFGMGNGAPWEKALPDTKSTRDFPSFADIAMSTNKAGFTKTNV